MYKRWDRWTCTATDEQTLAGSCNERAHSIHKVRERDQNRTPCQVVSIRHPRLCRPGVDRNIKKRAVIVVVVSCSATGRVEGNERLAINCGRKTRKVGWSFWVLLDIGRVPANNVLPPPSDNRPDVGLYCSSHGHTCCTTLGIVSFHTPTKMNSCYVRNREINSRHCKVGMPPAFTMRWKLIVECGEMRSGVGEATWESAPFGVLWTEPCRSVDFQYS